MHGPVGADELFSGHVAYLLDPGLGLSLDDALGASAGEFAPVTGQSADFGYTRDAIWLRLALRNDTSDATAWRLHLRENFLPEFSVWLIDATGGRRLLEQHDPLSPFDARQIAWPEIVVPFTLDPGSAGTILLRYTSGGSSELSFSLHTAESFEPFAARKTAKNFVYYGMMLFLILAALVAWVITRHSVFATYGAYAATGLIFLMHADGNTFQYLWPGWPRFNAYASVLVGAALVVTGSSFARVFLQTARYHPVMDRVLLGAILLALGMVAATAVMDTQQIKKALILVATGSTLLFTIAGLVAARRRFREVRFYVIAWTGAVASSLIMTGRHWLGIEISAEFQPIFPK